MLIAPANNQIIITKNNCDNCRVDNCHRLKSTELYSFLSLQG